MNANNNLNIRKMKKIGKLAINAEKVIKNEELVNVKGGYNGCTYCYCYGENGLLGPAILLTGSAVSCWDSCIDIYGSSFTGHRCS